MLRIAGYSPSWDAVKWLIQTSAGYFIHGMSFVREHALQTHHIQIKTWVFFKWS